MNQEILINWSPQETRVAVIAYGAVQDVFIERTLERGLVGNVYMGKVTRVLPGMQSAFIDIGLERAAFLHVADLLPNLTARHQRESGTPDAAGATAPPIERQVYEGQSILVQVLKDPIGSKGARLTAQISIAGRLLVYLPQDDHIGVSQKIPFELRQSLKTRLTDLRGSEKGGFILRTNAEDASDDELAQDIAYLQKMWQEIRDRSKRMPAPSLLHGELSLAQRVLRDLSTHETTHIRVDAKGQLAELKAFAETFMPDTAQKLSLYTGERVLFDLFNVDAEIALALQRRVPLRSGGYLVIDQTEALTTIDVNTGGFVGVKNFEETIFKTNLEAAQAAARQLRLRNLGGIIIIDFIDMAQESHRSAVVAELQKHLRRDRTKTMVGEFSPLGLLELTRKRTRESLAHILSETCPTCQGGGAVKTARTVCYEILRELLTEARNFNPEQFTVVAHPRVIAMLEDEESAHLSDLCRFVGKPVALQADASLSPEHYDIVLR
jgi:ribonuclease G